ncbi:MAG: putative oxidoreductase C-terminal domain-containing protein [Luteolibacter sp.]
MNLTKSISAMICMASLVTSSHAEPTKTFRLMTLDPGHFHAALVQRNMLPGVSPEVHIFAPAGPDLDLHLGRVKSFNTREVDPTTWDLKVHTSPDFLAKMLAEKPGNVVVLAGNNRDKTRYILESVKAGLHVMADKPMAIDPAGLKMLEEAYRIAEEKKLLLLDIMTERFEITTRLQKEFSQFPEVFGELDKGTPENPSVTKESVHHFSKLVNNLPLQRPPWFFDPAQQGEAIVDVTTHLVDLVQWECFPDQVIQDGDVNVISAKSWDTEMTLEQFQKVTKLDAWPEYLKPMVGGDGLLRIPANGAFTYALRGVHAKISVLWNFEAPPGTADTHDSLMRGTKCSLHIRQGKEQAYKPILYIEPHSDVDATSWKTALDKAAADIARSYPGVVIKDLGGRYEVAIPDSYKAGHEAHFAQVAGRFLGFLKDGGTPSWEVPNTLAKYRTIMEAYKKSRPSN